MISVEYIRKVVINKLLDNPCLGVNYVDWHTENSGECGVTITIGKQKFDILIKHNSMTR